MKIEKMKIDSKKRYKENRVMSGHAPHKMLRMEQQKMLAKVAKKETEEKVSDVLSK